MEFYICKRIPPTNNPTTSVPTTASPTSANPTRSRQTTYEPTSLSSTGSNPTRSPITASPTSTDSIFTTKIAVPSLQPSLPPSAVTPKSQDLVIAKEEDEHVRNDLNDPVETTEATYSEGNKEFIQNNDESSFEDILYYIIGIAAFCCIISGVLIYCFAVRRKNRLMDGESASAEQINASSMQTNSTTSHTQIYSHSPRSDDGIGSGTEPSNFVNGLGSLSAGNAIIMDDIVNHMETPMGDNEHESESVKVDTDIVFEGEQDIPSPPAVHRKLQSLVSHQSDYEVEMDDIMVTPNQPEDVPQEDEDEIEEDDIDIVMTTNGGDIDGIGRDEFIVEGHDHYNEANFEYNYNVTMR